MIVERCLILASASPRRFRLLREAGFDPVVHPAEIDESIYPAGLTPTELVKFLAATKAKAVARLYPTDITLGADTMVALGLNILGKPLDAGHAREMLAMLSGSLHQVISGVALVGPDRGLEEVIAVTSTVRMRPLSSLEIDQYIATKRWQDKAGGYGIQDNDPFVTQMSGSLTNIVGLPMVEVIELLRAAEISPAASSHPHGTIIDV